ncbi:MAG: DUF2235 domain-containing protein [Polyangiaceae bacterium]|nr:DUF2235 domain-containing protein [Polyangiaceae bacterium]
MSAAETAIDNMAKGQALPRQAPTGTEVCPEGCVRIGVFFDGTGNNYHKDKNTTDPMNPPKDGRAPSNVAKLWEVYKEEGTILKKLYHHGVGTDSEVPKGVGTSERVADWRGAGFGAGGKARVQWGRDQLSDFFSNNNNHLAGHKQFDTYGFSRGAAIARDFVNEVKTKGIDNLKKENGFKYRAVGRVVIKEKVYERHQGLEAEFLGVFDTVASFGLGGLQTGNDWAGYDLFVDHKWVKRTVHMAAEDEIRGNFPLSSLFMDPKAAGSQNPQDYKDVMIEIWYPGVHSDVGGGYVIEKGEEAKPERTEWVVGGFGGAVPVRMPATPGTPDIKPFLSLIPLRDMHKASIRAEVPLGGLSVNVPGDLEGWYNEYDGYRAGQPYAIGKQYIQTFESATYRRMYYDERDKQPSIINLKAHYIHDSRWATDKLTNRKQRTVLYMGPQPARS